jgi:hypothetical protein
MLNIIGKDYASGKRFAGGDFPQKYIYISKILIGEPFQARRRPWKRSAIK